ncbi:MAG TPA: DUF2834 domain-containing protein [Acidobacteriota bacterium]|nr:DUF2834 domain-containing protein [Acidobacteriota bacterium]
MWLLIVALFGLLLPNGLFIYWLLNEFHSLSEVLSNHLAVAFMLDSALAVVVLAYLFAIRPLGRLRWQWFVLFSVIGGLGFSIPFYLWLNQRKPAV